ncbi:MAG: thioredoxin family protein [Armatimonadetes bacterium]|nr:thioredoxin family protein [Armatimonadota bacterium]MDW8121100.1 thioredoxin family protein [Armatimonadota bacterium]
MRILLVTIIALFIATFSFSQDLWTKTVSQAKKEKKRILVYLTDDECLNCVRFYRQTVGNRQLKALVDRFVVLKLSAPEETKLFRKLVPEWSVPEKALVLPALAFFTPDGRLHDWVEGHLSEAAFASYLRLILKGEHSQSAIADYRAGKRDLATLYRAAVWYLERGDGTRGLPLAQRVIKGDPNNAKGLAAPAWLHIGLYYATHQPRKANLAIEAFREIVNRWPDTKEAQEGRFYLGVTHLALGQDKDAKRWLMETVKRKPSQPIKEAAQRLLNFLEREPPADLRRGDEPH